MMKKFAGMFVLFTALAAVSCSKDDDDAVTPAPVTPVSTANFMKFTAGGTDYNFSNPETIRSLNTSITAMGGTSLAYRRISLYIPNNATIGSHNVTDEPSNVDSYGVLYTTSDQAYDGTAGTITITAITSDHYEGNFSVTVTNPDITPTSVTITNGSFRVDKV